jgi:hypothetical protein
VRFEGPAVRQLEAALQPPGRNRPACCLRRG